MTYSLIYSDRKSIGITVKNTVVTVRAPRGVSQKRIDDLLKSKEKWIIKNIEKQKERLQIIDVTDTCEIKFLKKTAREYFQTKTKEFSQIMGLNYSSIKITSAKGRYGSCNSKGNICYSYRLMLSPEPAREYVIVHELCHLIELNHSKKIYGLLEKYLPDYKERRKMLL